MRGSSFHTLAPVSSGSRLAERAHQGLLLLWEAALYAHELGRDLWDFALEIGELRRAGLGHSDLRWMLCMGYLEHGRELTLAGQPARGFQPSPALSFGKRSCFVLTERGQSFVASVLDPQWTRTIDPGHPLAGPSLAESLVPCWDRARQELRLGSVVVKQFKAPAPNQERILAAFEEEGWPIRMDDPLPPQRDQDPKRRLHDTINALNRNQKTPLIHFTGDGSGRGVRWAVVVGDPDEEMKAAGSAALNGHLGNGAPRRPR